MSYIIQHKEGTGSEHRYNSTSGFAIVLREREVNAEIAIVGQVECVGEAAGADILSTSASVQMEKTIKRMLGEPGKDIQALTRHSEELIHQITSGITLGNQIFEDKNTESAYAVSFSLLICHSNTFWLFRIGRCNAYIQRHGQKECAELPRQKGTEVMAGGDIILRSYVGSTESGDADLCTGAFEEGDVILLCAGNTSMPTETTWDTVLPQIEQNQTVATMVDLWQITRTVK